MDKLTITNRKARFDYEVLESFEAGLVLSGPEIKAIRAKQASLAGAFVRPLQIGQNHKIELWLINSHFSQTPEPERSRKLLMHRKEISRLIGRVNEKGLTLVPLDIYIKHGKAKLGFALARGKKAFEKRATIKQRDLSRELRRES